MTTILQINLNCCKAAQALMYQMAAEKSADFLIVSEFNKADSSWYVDSNNKAAIVSVNHTAITNAGTSEAGFRWIAAAGMRIYSCYWSPNTSLADYHDFLFRLERSIRTSTANILLAGDFNAKHSDWGSSKNDPRGEALSELIHALGLLICNTGNDPTFKTGSILDVTFSSKELADRISDWAVLDVESLSDHNYVQLNIRSEHDPVSSAAPPKTKRKFILNKLADALSTDHPFTTSDPTGAEDSAVLLTTSIHETCMIESPAVCRRRSVYWWTPAISVLRKSANHARRVFQRKMKRMGPLAAVAERRAAKDAKLELVKAIKAAKDNAWKALCDQVERDPWGTPYKLVMGKLKRHQPIPGLDSPGTVGRIVNVLFPTHPPRAPGQWPNIPASDITGALITTEEVRTASSRIKNKISPGPDGIPNEALKLLAVKRPDILANVYNKCIREGHFPVVWKKARLVLLRKGDKPLQDPSSYRPLCLLDSAAKLLEKIIDHRLRAHLDTNNGLSDRQFGFRCGRSTTDAVSLLMTTAEGTGSNTKTGVLTLDIKNAFNSAPWDRILEALRAKDTPAYLCKLIDSYLSDRSITYATTGAPIITKLSSGVPQGSVLGPTLWNILYDDLLNVRLPQSVTPIAFADDIALVSKARENYTIEKDLTESARRVCAWLEETGLQIAAHKSEVIVITNKRTHNNVDVTVDGSKVQTSNCIKYLGVQIDSKLNFTEHADTASSKASAACQKLSRIMPNISAATSRKRKLLGNVVHSLLLFGAPIWANRMSSSGKAKMAKVQRKTALRVSSAYCTVSADAALVVASMPPIDILAKERLYMFSNKDDPGSTRTAKESTLRLWQTQWDESSKGRWTHRLIPSIATWANRKYGNVNFHLTQFLTGHGCFPAYLHRFGNLESPACWYCGHVEDDARHTAFVCDAWETRRSRVNTSLGTPLTPDNIIPLMLRDKNSWDTVSAFIHEVMGKKEDEERRRQADEVNQR